jgi:hypothetical protein
MVHQDGMEYGESHCPKCYDSQAGLARSATTAPSYDVKQQPENSISKEFDRQEQIQDERIKEHYRNEVRNSFNR